MELTRRQQDILLGMLLGDAYLQPTGSKNARLRLEHSLKQREYMDWKYSELEHIFQSEPQYLQRTHPLSQRTYQYVRLQSYALEFLGEVRRQFYSDDSKKKLPRELNKLLTSPLTIAVWYMDDGYWDKRDKSAHIYLQKFDVKEIERLIDSFKEVHGINCRAYCRPDRQACQLNFRSVDKDKFMSLVKPHIIDAMSYKIAQAHHSLSPVTTELERVR